MSSPLDTFFRKSRKLKWVPGKEPNTWYSMKFKYNVPRNRARISRFKIIDYGDSVSLSLDQPRPDEGFSYLAFLMRESGLVGNKSIDPRGRILLSYRQLLYSIRVLGQYITEVSKTMPATDKIDRTGNLIDMDKSGKR